MPDSARLSSTSMCRATAASTRSSWTPGPAIFASSPRRCSRSTCRRRRLPMVDQELLKILVCPHCRGQMQYREPDSVIACNGECRYEYPVVNDIPHMLIDEAVKP